MARRPQGTSGHEICGRWCIYGKYIQPWASRGGGGVFKNPDFCGESFSQTQKLVERRGHRPAKTPRDACDACRRAKVSGLGVSLLTARGRHTQHSSPAPRSPHPQPNHSPTRLKGCSCSRPSLCQHAGTDVDGWLPPDPDPRRVPGPSVCQHAGIDVDGWLPPDPDPRRVPAHQCPPSTATLCIDRPGPRSNPPHAHRTTGTSSRATFTVRGCDNGCQNRQLRRCAPVACPHTQPHPTASLSHPLPHWPQKLPSFILSVTTMLSCFGLAAAAACAEATAVMPRNASIQR